MNCGATSRILSRTSTSSAIAAWNYTIRAAVDGGRCREALQVYGHMRRAGAKPDNLTFPFVAKACAGLSEERTAGAAHAHVVKSPFWSDVFVQTAMVDMYVKCGRLDAAQDLFGGMLDRDVAAWNAMMAGFAQMGCLRRSLNLFLRMRLEEFDPDLITVILLTQACAVEKSLQVTRSIHSLGIRMGIGADVTVANTWISAYSKCDDLGSAALVFSEISLGNRTVVSWNSMIAGYAHLERLSEAATCFHEMHRCGVRPDLSTCVSLLSLFAHSAALSEGKMLHSLSIREGFDSDSSIGNTLISLYSKCGDVDVARFCFDSMPRRTCVSWTAMIDGYALKGDIDGVVDLFHAMQAAGEKPDCATIVAVLSVCGRTGALELGRLMDEYAVMNGFDEEIIVCNALLDMYVKCGSCVKARRLFNKMHRRNIVSWTTMISGYAMNGDFDEALGVFSQMVESDVEPNHITFLAVLQACTHAGFLEKGWEYFGMMTEIYKIVPGLEHYACMVDLLGRKGKVKKALEFVQNMPIKPDAVVWGALLGACVTHHEIEVGECAAYHLFEIEPQTAVSYVSMANVYASRGKWDGVAKIRVVMREKGTRKSPGQSSVHVDGQIHVFGVQDTNHPEIFHIYEVLHRLSLLMTRANYEMDLRCVLACELE